MFFAERDKSDVVHFDPVHFGIYGGNLCSEVIIFAFGRFFIASEIRDFSIHFHNCLFEFRDTSKIVFGVLFLVPLFGF